MISKSSFALANSGFSVIVALLERKLFPVKMSCDDALNGSLALNRYPASTTPVCRTIAGPESQSGQTVYPVQLRGIAGYRLTH